MSERSMRYDDGKDEFLEPVLHREATIMGLNLALAGDPCSEIGPLMLSAGIRHKMGPALPDGYAAWISYCAAIRALGITEDVRDIRSLSAVGPRGLAK